MSVKREEIRARRGRGRASAPGGGSSRAIRVCRNGGSPRVSDKR